MVRPSGYDRPFWQKPSTLLVGLFAGVAAALIWSGNRTVAPFNGDVEMIEGSITQLMRMPGIRGPKSILVVVQLDNGATPKLRYDAQDMSGCDLGSSIRLEKRADDYRIADLACPNELDS